MPSPFVRVKPDDDGALLRAARALAHDESEVQTPQVGPRKPSEHWRPQPAVGLPERTAEKSWRLAGGTSGLSHVGVVHEVEGERPGGQEQVPLARATP